VPELVLVAGGLLDAVVDEDVEPPPHAVRRTAEYNVTAATATLSSRSCNIPVSFLTEKPVDGTGLLPIDQ
jgi:hypothetical protein